MAERYVRVGNGQYRDTQTGKIINSATKPVAPKAAAPKTPAANNPAAPPATQDPASIAGGANVIPDNTTINSVGQGINTNATVAEQERKNNIITNNPNYSGPDGSSTVTIDPVTGKPTQTVTRSGGQQDIANKDDALSSMGRDFASNQLGQLGQFNPNLTQRTTTGDLLADRQKVEDAVYGRLTKDTDQRQKNEQQDVEQQLANRGVPYSNDPNSQYQQQMKDFTNKYENIRSDARTQATVIGGNEFRSDADLNARQRADDYSQQQNTYGTQLGAIQGTSQLGGGLRDVGNPGFQGSAASYGSPSDIAAQQRQLALTKLGIDASNKKSGGGRATSGNSTSTTAAPFAGY